MTEIWRTCCYQDGCLVLLLAMADHGEDDGTEIYPGLDLLAAKCRSSVRAVQDRLKKLRADGVVKILDPDGNDLPDDMTPPGGRGRKTEYRIDLERVQELHALHQLENPDCEHCKARAKRASRRRTKGAAARAKGEAGNVKGAADRSTYRIEPSKPSLNLPPAAARDPDGRAAGLSLKPQIDKLRERIGDDYFQAYFGGAEFIDTAPIKIVVPRESIRVRIKEKYIDKLVALFGDDVMLMLGESTDA